MPMTAARLSHVGRFPPSKKAGRFLHAYPAEAGAAVEIAREHVRPSFDALGDVPDPR